MRALICTAVIAVCLLFDSTAHSHPQDSDSFTRLPAGTMLVSKRSVNIMPGFITMYFSAGQLITDKKMLRNLAPYCILNLEYSSYDREFTPDVTALFMTGVPVVVPSSSETVFHYFEPAMLVYFNQVNNPYRLIGSDPTTRQSERSLICLNPNGRVQPNSYDISLSIGDVKKILGGYFEIQLPEPRTFR